MKNVIEIKITTIEAEHVLEALSQQMRYPVHIETHESVKWFHDRLAIAINEKDDEN